jgi:hypothetical protein
VVWQWARSVSWSLEFAHTLADFLDAKQALTASDLIKARLNFKYDIDK